MDEVLEAHRGSTAQQQWLRTNLQSAFHHGHNCVRLGAGKKTLEKEINILSFYFYVFNAL